MLPPIDPRSAFDGQLLSSSKPWPSRRQRL